MLKSILISILLSDQLYKWSDEYSERTFRQASETTQLSSASSAPAAFDLARLFDRAIQAVRQARMQMRRRSWTRPQVLSVGELPGPAAADGLRAAGGCRAGRGVSIQLPSGARDPGPDLRDQPRVAAPPRGALKRCHGRIADSLPCTDRDGANGSAGGEYAGGLAGRRPGAFALCGGRR